MAFANQSGSTGGTTQANGNGAGSIPVTGSSAGKGFNISADYGFNAFDVNALGGSSMITVNLHGATAAHMEICSSSGTAIYQWFSTSMWSTWYKVNGESARWVRLPSFTNAKGMTCTSSWLPGLYASK